MNNLQTKLWKKARIAASILKIVPNITAVAVTGSLAQGKANQKSDIDFLIVCRPKRIWTTRFFSTLLLQILGLRRIGKKIAGKICLNWYITSPNYDKYTKGWPVKIVWQRSNIEIRNPKSETISKSKCSNSQNSFGHLDFTHSNLFRYSIFDIRIFKKIGDFIENFLKIKQIARIKKDPRTCAPGSRVKYEDDEIGFWPSRNA